MSFLNHTDYTLTSPAPCTLGAGSILLGLTILWHPDTERIGEQFVLAGETDKVEINRFLPLFRKPGEEGLALAFAGISRDPVVLQRDANQGVLIHIPASRMVVELNGQVVTGQVYLRSKDIRAGAMLGLGRSVMICLHWLNCLPQANPIEGLLGVGSSAIMLREQIRQMAATDLPVLLLGETGTGKEIIARAIHGLSSRAKASLLTVNMAALSDGLAAADLFGASKGAYTGAQNARKGWFAQAENATLFLDEIGNAPTVVQPMLLRVLEDGSYRPLGAEKDQHTNARLIAATDQDLYSVGFNQALLRRLECIVIHLPPLRERREDIGVILRHALSQHQHLASEQQMVNASPMTTLPYELISAIANYDWPGNIRQLVHAASRIKLALQRQDMSDWQRWLGISRPAQLKREELEEPVARFTPSAPVTHPAIAKKPVSELGQADVIAAMDNNQWYIQCAARDLGISRPTMYKLLERYARSPDQIPNEEIRAALQIYGDDMEACAAHLKTPTKALRRHLRDNPISAS